MSLASRNPRSTSLKPGSRQLRMEHLRNLVLLYQEPPRKTRYPFLDPTELVHSHKLPAISYNPQALGLYLPTGDVLSKPSSILEFLWLSEQDISQKFAYANTFYQAPLTKLHEMFLLRKLSTCFHISLPSLRFLHFAPPSSLIVSSHFVLIICRTKSSCARAALFPGTR